jgi:acetyl esterase/lipase
LHSRLPVTLAVSRPELRPSLLLSNNRFAVPKQSCPCAVNELRDAYTYLMTQYKFPNSKILLMGDSAGGNIAAALSVQIRDDASVGQPAGTVLVSPWLDLTLSHSSKSPCVANDWLGPSFQNMEVQIHLGS